jgi:hypothetical protein
MRNGNGAADTGTRNPLPVHQGRNGNVSIIKQTFHCRTLYHFAQQILLAFRRQVRDYLPLRKEAGKIHNGA